MWNRRQLIAAGAASLATCVGAPAIAQNFPNRAVTMVVPFPAGGITDAVARALASKMGEQLGKPVIVDNRPGGGGQIAAAYVRQQAADGHTLYVGATEMFAINPRCFAISHMTR
jgi:tripartite-type tricarboxylate transporter receptor subunit TctC